MKESCTYFFITVCLLSYSHVQPSEYVQAAEQHIDLDEHSIMLKLTDAFQDKNEIYSK
jgi:hypothetical protein